MVERTGREISGSSIVAFMYNSGTAFFEISGVKRREIFGRDTTVDVWVLLWRQNSWVRKFAMFFWFLLGSKNKKSIFNFDIENFFASLQKMLPKYGFFRIFRNLTPKKVEYQILLFILSKNLWIWANGNFFIINTLCANFPDIFWNLAFVRYIGLDLIFKVVKKLYFIYEDVHEKFKIIG